MSLERPGRASRDSLQAEMEMSDNTQEIDIAMDPSAMYLEEVFTDRAVGTIRRLTPVDGDGKPKAGEAPLYVGQAQLMTPMGALPLNFEIPAKTLQEAAQRFGEEAKVAVEQAARELQELRREAASSIVVPGQGGAGGVGGMGGMGGLGGPGGKIQIP